jgi:GNAT superfamily N-acetyltransferase
MYSFPVVKNKQLNWFGKKCEIHEMIRRANAEDAKNIHDAHMFSIQAVCSKDHSPEEVAAWGGRLFDAQREMNWLNSIRNQHVWVVELEKKIEGYGHLRVFEKDGQVLGHIHGLYLTPTALGKKFGSQMAKLMMNEALKSKVERLTLESTITAHGFYKRIGFHDHGPMITVEIAGTPIRCFPMVMNLKK